MSRNSETHVIRGISASVNITNDEFVNVDIKGDDDCDGDENGASPSDSDVVGTDIADNLIIGSESEDDSGRDCCNNESSNNDSSATTAPLSFSSQEQLITAESEIATTTTTTASSSPSSSPPQRSSLSEREVDAVDDGAPQSPQLLRVVTVASVVDESETERDRLELIAETEARVRRECGMAVVDTSMEIVEAKVIKPSSAKTSTKKRRKMIIIGITIIIIIVLATIIAIAVKTSFSKESIINNTNNEIMMINAESEEQEREEPPGNQEQEQEQEQQRLCGEDKLNSFIEQNSWLKQYFDWMFSTEKYQKAAKSCQKEIQLYTEITNTSCYLENQYNSSWNYGDRWIASSNNYAISNDGIMNGAAFMDGHYMLAVVFDDTFNFTLPVLRPHICTADCYMDSSWNNMNNTCDFYDKPGPPRGHVYNPYGIDSLWTSQSTISREIYCNANWGKIDLAWIDIKICAAKTIGEPFLLTHDEYVCFMEYEKFRNKKCGIEHYCDSAGGAVDVNNENEFIFNNVATLQDYCQISSETLDLIHRLTETTWI